MKSYFYFIMLCFSLLLIGTSCLDVPILTVEGGQIRGCISNSKGVAVYRGIPYAAPPLGPLRWKKPHPVVSWDTIRDCTHFAPASIQAPQQSHSFYGREFSPNGTPDMSEDCLYLNVWAPTETLDKPGSKLPVMMWIHGGAFLSGYGHEIEFDGEAFARKGVILVTINYRLGMLGFLSHPWLTVENHGKGSGNQGLFDQLQALKWIRKNIAAFGGDSNNITIAGQSAGAGSVQALIASPLAKGLFQKAVVQSGGGLGGLVMPKSTEWAQQAGVRIWDKAGVRNLEEMRAYPAQKLDSLLGLYLKEHFKQLTDLPCVPCIDGEFTSQTYDESALQGLTPDVPCLIGYTAQDIVPEMMFRAASDWSLLQEKQHKRPSYIYCFAHDLPGDDLPDLSQVSDPLDGAFHSSELWYMMGTLGKCWRPMSDYDHQLSNQMVDYWTNFCKKGDPNAAGLPAWLPYTADNHFVMDLK